MKILNKFIINQNMFDKICSNPIIFIKIIISQMKAKLNNFSNILIKIL